jgi:diadenosine tetraphosphate (Ap4A) HIT family hydrolase
MSTCKICAELTVKNGRAPWNEFLLETEHFAVIPSLGALVEGWLLIVPKAHFISMGAVPTDWRQEADELQIQVQKLLRDRYNQPVLTFEHGPSAANHGTGCGVDHAHLHAVPLNCDILQFVEPFVPAKLEWKLGDWKERAEAYQAGLDYLYFKAEESTGRIALSRDFGSQVFRKAISSYLGIPEEFSWREYPQLAVVKRTIEAFSGEGTQIEERGTEHAA